MEWLPSASIPALEKRAQLFKQLRAFFDARGILEVDVPLLSPYTVTDVHLEPLVVTSSGPTQYLQTSPEYYLKRIVCRDQRCLYYLGKAFRQEESGRRHRSEFTMLEWYRMGFNDHDLMDEVTALFAILAPHTVCERISYADLFLRHLNLNPHFATIEQLAEEARSRTSFQGELALKSQWLDLLFSFCIEPTLDEKLTLVFDYPVQQSALARTAWHADGYRYARRFEVYWCGIELANGYWELADAEEQLTRFQQDRRQRQELGLPAREIDPKFMAALNQGLPDCAGIALGVDRVLMCMTGHTDIQEVMPFANG